MSTAQAGSAVEAKLTPARALSLLPNDRWHPLELAFWLAGVAAAFAFPEYRVLVSQIFITSLFALSLDLILGHAGIVSLGHAAFFGIGAYTAGLLASHGWGEPITGLLLGGVLATVVGRVVGLLVVGVGGLSQLMVTLGVGLLFFEAANRAAPITGGVDGLYGVSMWKLFGVFEFDLFGTTACWYSFVVLFAAFLLLRRIVASPFGLSLRGIREGPRRMPALGAPVDRRRLAAFTLGAGLAGLAGALLAQTTQFVGLDVLSFSRSADLLIMVVLGGAGRLYGALIGATLFMLAQDRLSGMDPIYWQFWIGLLLVVVVLFARGGVLDGLERLYRALARRKAA